MTKKFIKHFICSTMALAGVVGCMPQPRSEVSVKFQLPNTVSAKALSDGVAAFSSCYLEHSSICAYKTGGEAKCVNVAASTDPSGFSGISSGQAVLNFAPAEEMTLTAGDGWNFYYLGVFGSSSCTAGDSIVSFGRVSNVNLDTSSKDVSLEVITPQNAMSQASSGTLAEGFTNARFQLTDSAGSSCSTSGTIVIKTAVGDKSVTLPSGMAYSLNVTSGSASLDVGPLPKNMSYTGTLTQVMPVSKTVQLTFSTNDTAQVVIPVTADNVCSGPVVTPTAPSGLSVGSPTASSLVLSWTDNSSDEVGFLIERSPNGSTGWGVVTTTASNVTSYTNTGLSASTTYYYRVRAAGASGDSAYTSVASGTTSAGGGGGGGAILTMDSGGSYNYGVTSVGVNVDHTFTVTNSSGSATASGMSGNMSSAEFIFIGGSYPGTGGTCGSSLAAGASCTLKTRFNPSSSAVLNGTLEISYTNGTAQALTVALTGDATGGGGGGAPSTPGSLVAYPSTPGPGITITWADVSGENGYLLERKIGSGGSFTQIANPMSNEISYEDTAASTGGETYYYRVRAYNAGGNSGYSSEASVVHPP